MLKGLDAYGSDESDTELSIRTESKPAAEGKSNTSTSLLSLPPPVNSAKPRPRRAVFTIAKPTKSPSLDEEEHGEEQRPAKKPKLDIPAGKSSLLAMLPAPSKSTIPVPSKTLEVKRMTVINRDLSDGFAAESAAIDDDTPLIPVQSLRKSNTKARENSSPSGVDFFSLGSSHSSVKRMLPISPSVSSISTSVSSAPAVPTFEPPEPTPQDPYPGYYQLPSGQWAAYDSDYYMKYYNSWTADVQQLDNESKYAGAVQIDVQAQLDLARKEQEDRKALTKSAGGGPSAPRMNIKAAKAGSLAKTRHQLSTLLTDAYENREALEERIAQAKRNRKESGNKYGF